VPAHAPSSARDSGLNFQHVVAVRRVSQTGRVTMPWKLGGGKASKACQLTGAALRDRAACQKQRGEIL
jgi:hypothetical protein